MQFMLALLWFVLFGGASLLMFKFTERRPYETETKPQRFLVLIETVQQYGIALLAGVMALVAPLWIILQQG